jgi:hypothetical protein
VAKENIMFNFVSGSIATRRPRTTFAREIAQATNDVRIGDSVITRRLQARDVNVYATPVSVTDGFARRLGRINYAAAISRDDAEAVAALAEENERRNAEIAAKRAV